MSTQNSENEVLEQARMKVEEAKGKERRNWKELIDKLESEEVQQEYSGTSWVPGD